MDDSWLAIVSDRTRAFVEQRARLKRFADRAFIYHVGDVPNGLYQVVSGEVRLYSYPDVGRQLLTLIAREQDWFGELSVIDGGPRPQDAICHGAVAVRHVPMSEISTFAQTDPAIYGQIALIACAHQRAALKFIGTTLSKTGRARLAEMILNMLPRDGGSAPETLAISQEDLAGRMGVTRQHLNILLSDLKRSGVAISYGKIHVKDREMLASVADES